MAELGSARLLARPARGQQLPPAPRMKRLFDEAQVKANPVYVYNAAHRPTAQCVAAANKLILTAAPEVRPQIEALKKQITDHPTHHPEKRMAKKTLDRVVQGERQKNVIAHIVGKAGPNGGLPLELVGKISEFLGKAPLQADLDKAKMAAEKKEVFDHRCAVATADGLMVAGAATLTALAPTPLTIGLLVGSGARAAKNIIRPPQLPPAPQPLTTRDAVVTYVNVTGAASSVTAGILSAVKNAPFISSTIPFAISSVVGGAATVVPAYKVTKLAEQGVEGVRTKWF